MFTNVDACMKGVASLFVACSGNPVTTVKISAAMRAKGSSDTEAVDQALQMQVCWEVEKLKGSCSLCSAAMVMLSSTLVAHSNRIPVESICFCRKGVLRKWKASNFTPEFHIK